MIKKSVLAVMVACLASALAGCASHEVVPSSGPRQPTTAQNVRIYQKHPKKYQELGVVSVSITPEMRWDERGDAPLAFDALKAKAAELGANGLLLILPPATYDHTVTAGYHGQFYQVPARRDPKTAMGQAIFVLED